MSISLSRNIMSKHESYKKEKDKAILYPGDHVMEWSASNILIVKNNITYTHPDGNLVLPGITKSVLLKIARIIVKEETFILDDLKKADEVFASSITMEAMLVIEMDDQLVVKGNMVVLLNDYRNFISMKSKQCVVQLMNEDRWFYMRRNLL